MQFKPNFDLIRYWPDAEHAHTFASNTAFVAVFRRAGKTLVYMRDNHWRNMAFDMVEMVFSDDFGIKPDVLVAEMENDGYERKLEPHWFQHVNPVHAIGVAVKKNIPVVFADLSPNQMVDVVNTGFPNNQITSVDLHKVLNAHPDSDGDIYQQMHAYLCLYGRDRFMLQNIAVALNKYDTVFAIFGGMHYKIEYSVLEDMMGKPEYITEIKNMRGDFSDVKIEPIKLCDFEMGGANDQNKTEC